MVTSREIGTSIEEARATLLAPSSPYLRRSRLFRALLNVQGFLTGRPVELTRPIAVSEVELELDGDVSRNLLDDYNACVAALPPLLDTSGGPQDVHADRWLEMDRLLGTLQHRIEKLELGG